MQFAEATVSELLGLTLASVTQIKNEELVFVSTDGQAFLMSHQQDCCEDVKIADVCGDLDDLVGAPILLAEVVVSWDPPEAGASPELEDGDVWTYYKFATVKGNVTIRWYAPNSYYSQSVDFERISPDYAQAMIDLANEKAEGVTNA